MQTLRVREWTYEEWLGSEPQWSDLLSRSSLDPLFLSWEWLVLWWEHFGGRRTHELCLLAAYDGETLVGIAPLYRLRAGRRMLPVRSLQFIGISWRDSKALISEYLDFISVPADRARVRKLFLDHLLSQDSWSELIVSYTQTPQAWTEAFNGIHVAGSKYSRTIEPCISYQADLKNGFSEYLAKLGQSTRRSLWHLRRRLAGKGDVRLELLTADQIGDGFADLNRLHLLRWGTKAFTGNRLQFHLSLAQNLAARGELAFSRLWLGDEVVSVIYDIRKDQRQYNIKMSFDPSIEKTFSLGLIHFGYAMEAAAGENVALYDFLAGRGRKTDYKSHLGQLQEPLVTVQLLKGTLLPRLYRWYDQRKTGAT